MKTPFDIEQRKYTEAYHRGHYGMGERRKQHAFRLLSRWRPGTILDVGCGRGEMMKMLEGVGFETRGTEIVKKLIDGKKVVFAKLTELPFEDGAFDYVVCMDVMEHLFPEDTLKAFRELDRVARGRVFLVIANFKHANYHINIRPYEEWNELIREVWKGHLVVWHARKDNISETWEIIKK